MASNTLQAMLEKKLEHALNINGFSFQYAVLDAARKYFEEGIAAWALVSSEFPVSVNDIPTHIDFILCHKSVPFFIIAECKRANPALSNWCFVKSPYVSRRTSSGEKIVRETVRLDPRNNHDPLLVGLECLERNKDVYRLAFELKGNLQGDGNKGRGQINDAITQVLRGLNGLMSTFITHFDKTKKLLGENHFGANQRAAFLPVIFTTANLWVSDIDLAGADLETGNIDIPPDSLRPAEWIYFQYAQSPDLKHDFGGFKECGDISTKLYLDFTRTIPIVSSAGIKSFLTKASWWEDDDWQREQITSPWG